MMPKTKKDKKEKAGVTKKPAPKGVAPSSKKAKKPVTRKKVIRKKKEDFRSTFLESLQAKRKELKETLERLLISRREYDGELTAGDFIDEVDDAQREISAYSLYSLIERKHRELRRIEYLIGRILKEEEFGLCEECGAQIPKERLLIVPEATLCIACQRELERQDRRSMSSKASAEFGSRKEMALEPSESQDDGDNLVIEYHISSMPSVEMEETDLDGASDDEKDEAE
ncbi:MAG: TraR/DksA family transcriptional regulator [Deltaproteobacteria bacterium]